MREQASPHQGGDERRETTMRLKWIAKRSRMEAAGSLANLLRCGEGNQGYADVRD
ncbi:MAG: hypothetical protein JWR26_4059 [Pedosphaera sp.]|nr:hypothetical protein [Pedosphaera sp.]